MIGSEYEEECEEEQEEQERITILTFQCYRSDSTSPPTLPDRVSGRRRLSVLPDSVVNCLSTFNLTANPCFNFFQAVVGPRRGQA
jgi:hypothetical protein